MVVGLEAAQVRHSGRRLLSPLSLDSDDRALLLQVTDYDHEALEASARQRGQGDTVRGGRLAQAIDLV